MNDSTIIDLLFERSEQGLALLTDKYKGLAVKLLSEILTDRSDVEECFNDLLLTVWNSIPPNRPQSMTAYVCTLTRRIGINRYKYNHRGKRDTYQLLLSELDEAIPDPASSVMDEATLIATGVTYDEYMKTGAWLTKPNGNDHFHAMTNAAGGDVRFSLYKWVDHEYLREFVEKLHFVKGDKEITSIARIYHEFGIPYGYPRCDVCVLWVGYDADGRAYACIDGYYAEITPEEAEAFKAVFVGADRRNDSYVCYH